MYGKEGQESTSTERWAYVVYDRRDPKRFVTGRAVTAAKAREAGAQRLTKQERLKVTYEDVFAVAMHDGETAGEAILRGVDIDSIGKAVRGGK